MGNCLRKSENNPKTSNPASNTNAKDSNQTQFPKPNENIKVDQSGIFSLKLFLTLSNSAN